MEYQRRKSAVGTPTAAVCRAVAVGMIVGLLLSLAGFYHRSKLEAVQGELMGDLSYQETTATDERHKRELAEQMQAEADTERTKLQGQVKELSSAALDAQESERKAKKAQQEAETALAKAEDRAAEAEDKANNAEEKASATIAKLERQLQQMKASKHLGDFAASESARAEETTAGTRDRHSIWLPSPERDAGDPELAELLRRVGKNNEVMVAVSNRNLVGLGGMLDVWMRNVKRAGVTNAMVVALDEETERHAESQGFDALLMSLEISESQKNVGQNHAVSGLKFKILKRFLDLGYSVLLSDVDIITLQNPFPHLYKDSDVESMSDGWDNATAYGYDDVSEDPSMGWARYAHSMRIFCFNSGLFYIRPTQASLDLLKLVIHRIETEAGWDQQIFNEVIFFPSHGAYKDPTVTRRVMDFYQFMNSKVLFKQVRYQKKLKQQLPITVHINYHANKHERLLAVEKFWVKGDDTDMMKFPEGS